eukprot:jgi/Mesen1/5022/ME000025S04424
MKVVSMMEADTAHPPSSDLVQVVLQKQQTVSQSQAQPQQHQQSQQPAQQASIITDVSQYPPHVHQSLLIPPPERSLPQPVYDHAAQGLVMSPEQLETLRRQISVYSTICQQLVAMHQAMAAQQIQMNGGGLTHHHHLYETTTTTTTTVSAGIQSSAKARVRWTPQAAQLQILERYFMQGNGTPNKVKIKEITQELSQHGQISETNVYNWFQNRKARAKRKGTTGSNGTDKDGEGDETEVEEGGEKRMKLNGDAQEDEDAEQGNTDGELEESTSQVQAGESRQHSQEQQLQQHMQNEHLKKQATDQQLPREEPRESPGAAEEARAETDSLQQQTGEFDQEFSQPGGIMQVFINGKSWDVPLGLLDVKSSFGMQASIIDSLGQVVPTNSNGVTLESLQAGASYTLKDPDISLVEPSSMLPGELGTGEPAL